jgi:hypothetical protein
MNAHEKWLRTVAERLYKSCDYQNSNTCEEAADEIARLSARVVELEIALGNRSAVETKTEYAGFPVVEDPTVEPGTIELRNLAPHAAAPMVPSGKVGFTTTSGLIFCEYCGREWCICTK